MQITNATTPTLVFLLVSSTDDKTAVTGVTPTVQLSKNGGAFAGATNSPSEIANGWYKVALTTTETNTDGALIIRATGTGADEWRDVHQVLTTNPADVVSIANNAITAAAIADGAIDAATFAAGAIDAAAVATSAVSEIQSGLMLAASYSAPPSAAAIAAAVWDYLTSAATTVGSLGKRIADNLTGDAYARLGAPAGASVSADIAAIQAKTTNLPSSPAAVGSAMTLATDAVNAAAVATSAVTELQAGLMLAASYTAPDNTSIAAIKAKTDNLPASPAATSDIPSAAANAAALLDSADGVETGLTPRGALRLISAALAGVLSGAGGSTVTIRNVGDTKNRIQATVDSDGNRSAVTTDAS